MVEDAHASIVAAALAELGHSVTLWDSPVDSANIEISVHFDSAGQVTTVGGCSYPQDCFDAVWLRRRRPVPVPADLHPDDERFAKNEAAKFYDDFWVLTSPDARWIHSAQVADAGESKLIQLAVARRAGFNVPPTLVSNDRSAICAFIAHAQSLSQRVIYKTFTPVGWQEGDTYRQMYVRPVSREQIEQNSFIEAVPGIYQQLIEKKFEVRSTFFGSRALSVKIDSQAHPKGMFDWRNAINLKGYLSPIDLPSEVTEKCLRLMSAMSLSVGCFDFVVDKKGEYWFLEVNQQGQFLWVEAGCPEIPMLDAFVSFVTDDKTQRDRIRLSELMASEAHKKIAESFRKSRYACA